MSNTNNNMQTQTSSALHNAIMEVGGKDRPLMLAPSNYNPPYKFKSAERTIPVAEGIDNDTYSTVDACPNACEMWKAIERLKQSESINVQDLETNLYWEFGKFTSRDENLQKPTNNNLKTSSNTSRANQDNTPRINRGTGYDNQREVNVVGARENVAGIQLSAEQVDWKDDTDDEPEDQELEAHYLYMAQIQELTPDAADNSGPIFDAEPLQKVQDDDNYNMFTNDRQHPEQPESVNDTYPDEQGNKNIIIDSLDMSTNGDQADHNDDDLARERTFLASLIEKLKCEIDDSKT
ncbi:hypothetical protein Tco_1253339, partial [Tanacetum coccineum]